MRGYKYTVKGTSLKKQRNTFFYTHLPLLDWDSWLGGGTLVCAVSNNSYVWSSSSSIGLLLVYSACREEWTKVSEQRRGVSKGVKHNGYFWIQYLLHHFKWKTGECFWYKKTSTNAIDEARHDFLKSFTLHSFLNSPAACNQRCLQMNMY